MRFIDESCSAFVEMLSSKEPVPGGGGASAMVGALGVALGNMVGSLTLGKKKYADVEEDIQNLMDSARALQRDLLELTEKDAEVFMPLARAYGMPKDTQEEAEEKDRVMAKVLEDACRVPLEIMEKCCRAIDLHRDFAVKGSKLAVSDAGVGVIFLKSALQGASLNVFINTKAMKDRKLAAEIEKKTDRMLQEYTVKADEIFAGVFNQLRR